MRSVFTDLPARREMLDGDTTKVLANVIELSDQPFQGGTTLKAQYLSRLSIQRRTMALNIVDIDPDIHYIPVHRRLLIALRGLSTT